MPPSCPPRNSAENISKHSGARIFNKTDFSDQHSGDLTVCSYRNNVIQQMIANLRSAGYLGIWQFKPSPLLSSFDTVPFRFGDMTLGNGQPLVRHRKVAERRHSIFCKDGGLGIRNARYLMSGLIPGCYSSRAILGSFGWGHTLWVFISTPRVYFTLH